MMAGAQWREMLDALPMIDTHEHIGAFPATGMQWKLWGFRMDLAAGFEPPQITVLDAMLGTCFGLLLTKLGWPVAYHDELVGGGPWLGELRAALGTGRARDLLRARWQEIAPFVLRARGTGLYVAVDRGLRALHGAGLDELLAGRADIVALDEQVRGCYGAGLYAWCREAFNRGRIERALKPVHAVFAASVGRDPAGWQREHAVFSPLIRVDDFLGFSPAGPDEAWQAIADAVGVETQSLEDAEQVVERAFALFERSGVVGIKQAQAYLRSLEFDTVSRERAQAAWGALQAGEPGAAKAVQDYLLFRVAEQAGRRGWAFQIHTGLTRNVQQTSPVLLEELFQHCPGTRFVLIHCYPYFSEAAWLAREYPNVYLDTSWQAMLSPAALRQALREWIGTVPYPKICMSGDGMAVEDVYGALLVSREVLGQVLAEKVTQGELDDALALEIGRALLSGNARTLYHLEGGSHGRL